MVVVEKTNRKWRFCVDFMDLNKAFPKYPFSHPHIDSLVDVITGYEILLFMDDLAGFQQIQIEYSD